MCDLDQYRESETAGRAVGYLATASTANAADWSAIQGALGALASALIVEVLLYLRWRIRRALSGRNEETKNDK